MTKKVLVVGFNTRPLAYSLKEAEYDVYAVDFFGDLDLYPHVKDCLIVVKELKSTYNSIKDNYGQFLASFALDLLRKHSKINYLIIGSGLDDAFEERESIINEIQKNDYKILNANNNIETIKKARNIENLYDFLKNRGFNVPKTISFEKFESNRQDFQYPFILKKKTGSGGINVYKINRENELFFHTRKKETIDFNPSEWLIQEYIEGIPVSCTVISNGTECVIVSINRQIIGLDFVNSPKEFMYCGNVVPANLLKEDNKIITEISKTLSEELLLKGINGFDFVLKNHYPYLMEINPRIPGSIRVSETVLDLNLLDLHIQSFNPSEWKHIKNLLKSKKPKGFATKLIMFAPKEVNKKALNKVNQIKYVHDKSEPIKDILKDEPLCTVLYKGKSFSESYFGALKIVDEIKEIMD